MRGSTEKQAAAILRPVFAVGQSRHDKKNEARATGATTPHEIAKLTGIYGSKTYSRYKSIIKQFLDFSKANFGVKDAFLVTPEHVEAWLVSKIDNKVAYATIRTYASALEKMDVARERYRETMSKKHLKRIVNQSAEWSQTISEVRAIAKDQLESFVPSRAYAETETIFKEIQDPMHELVARLQHDGGGRISEVKKLTARNLPEHGKLHLINTKGGRPRTVRIPPRLWERVNNVIEQNGELSVNYSKYNKDLKIAVAKVGQQWHGTHGLRYNYARHRMEALLANGVEEKTAWLKVSKLLGHNRASITKYYLR